MSPPHFNYDYCWRPNIDKIKEERWATLLQVQSNDEGEQGDVASDGGSVRADQR